MRKRKLPPDTRPDWRDPNMPLTRNYLMGDGSRKTNVDPEYERRFREMLVATSTEPSWRQDPTYNMRRKR